MSKGVFIQRGGALARNSKSALCSGLGGFCRRGRRGVTPC